MGYILGFSSLVYPHESCRLGLWQAGYVTKLFDPERTPIAMISKPCNGYKKIFVKHTLQNSILSVTLIYIEGNHSTGNQEHIMYTTTDEKGIINNYSTEPSVNYAEYPSLEQQQTYLRLGALAGGLVVSLLTIAVLVSQ